MSMKKLFNNEYGKIIISIIWGLGLAALFRKVCNNRNCIIIEPVKYDKIKDKIYKFNNKCFKFYPKISKCK